MENFKVNTKEEKTITPENADINKPEDRQEIDGRTEGEKLAEKLANGESWGKIYEEMREKGIRMTDADIEKAHNELIERMEGGRNN